MRPFNLYAALLVLVNLLPLTLLLLLCLRVLQITDYGDIAVMVHLVQWSVLTQGLLIWLHLNKGRRAPARKAPWITALVLLGPLAAIAYVWRVINGPRY